MDLHPKGGREGERERENPSWRPRLHKKLALRHYFRKYQSPFFNIDGVEGVEGVQRVGMT